MIHKTEANYDMGLGLGGEHTGLYFYRQPVVQAVGLFVAELLSLLQEVICFCGCVGMGWKSGCVNHVFAALLSCLL
jgi:hypothetical protein